MTRRSPTRHHHRVHRFRHHPLIGTVVETVVELPDAVPDDEAHRLARHLDEVVVAEMVRLERVCSAFDPASELERWKRGEVPEPSADLSDVLAAALAFQEGSAGTFNPMVGVLTDAWRAAAAAGAPPAPAGLERLAASIADPRYALDSSGRPVATGDCSGFQLNAFAKGWIVDRALDVACRDGVAASVTVNAGGDLAHRGDRPTRVAVENPLRPYDNEPPLMTIELADAGLATSGRARKGVRIGGRWYSHVVDPRTGRPVDDVASVSVVARDAGTADAMATVLGVLGVDEALAWATERGLALLRIAPDGSRVSNAAWNSLGV